MSLSPDRHARNAAIFEARLKDALDVALLGGTAIVIVPAAYPKRFALSTLVLQAQGSPLKHALRATEDALHIEGTRGSVRIYPADHITYDTKQQRLLDYPATVPHFLHPEVEGL